MISAAPVTLSNAARARAAAGLSPKQAAKKARVGVRYLLHVERHGCDSLTLAERLASLYGCPIDLFLYAQKGEQPERGRGTPISKSASAGRRWQMPAEETRGLAP